MSMSDALGEGCNRNSNPSFINERDASQIQSLESLQANISTATLVYCDLSNGEW